MAMQEPPDAMVDAMVAALKANGLPHGGGLAYRLVRAMQRAAEAAPPVEPKAKAVPATSAPLFLHCRKCVQAGEHAGVTALVLDGDLMIVCRNHDHGLIHLQPFVGRKPLVCEHLEHAPGVPR